MMKAGKEKTKQHCVRCTGAEWEEVKAQAALRGQGISEYVLACTLGPATSASEQADTALMQEAFLSQAERHQRAVLVDRLHGICARLMAPALDTEGDVDISTAEAIAIVHAAELERRREQASDEDIYAALLSTGEGVGP